MCECNDLAGMANRAKNVPCCAQHQVESEASEILASLSTQTQRRADGSKLRVIQLLPWFASRAMMAPRAQASESPAQRPVHGRQVRSDAAHRQRQRPLVVHHRGSRGTRTAADEQDSRTIRAHYPQV